MSRDTPALFRRFPQAADRIPWVRLGDLPTSVRAVPTLAPRAAPATVQVKRDDLSSRLYGGNKVRALEFLLGDALSRRAEAIVTAGAVGSHHVSATARFAQEVGLRVEAVLWERPSGPGDPEAWRLLDRLGVPAHRRAGPAMALALLVWRGVLLRSRGVRVYVVPPGGASGRGALGFVDAALEFGEQIAAGEAEAPDSLWIACGTGVSTAGLLVGLPLAGIAASVRAVCVTPPLVCSRFRVRRLAHNARRILWRAGVPEAAARRGNDAPLDLLRDYYAPGYGVPTRAAEASVALLEAAGIHADTTYTGRALAALLEHAAPEGGRHLYWHTLPSRPQETGIQADAW